MNSDAIRCPSCGKLRKNIYTDKIICYTFCLAGGFLIGIAIALWKKAKPTEFDFYYNDTSSTNNTFSYVLLAIGIIAAIAGIYYYVRVSQKLKSWWWA